MFTNNQSQFSSTGNRFTVPQFSYLGRCRAGRSVAMVTLRVYVVGGDLGWGAFENVDVRDGKDALFGCAWDLALIPVLVHLSYHNYFLTLNIKKTTHL